MQKNLIFIIISILFFTSCSKLGTKENSNKDNTSTYKSINEFINNLDTYAAVTNITYISNNNENTYKTLQYCKKSGEYRTEVIEPENLSGSITMYDGSIIYQYNPKVSETIELTTTETSERTEIFLTSFLRNYSMSKEVSISVGNFDNSDYTVIEANIPGSHPYMSKEKLWINNETLLPEKLIVYDYNDQERIITKFEEFVFNPQLANEIFVIQE